MLKQDDYKTFVPQAEHEIKAHGHVSLLIHIAGLRGASPPALWEDLKFDASHYNDVARLALVGTRVGARHALRASRRARARRRS
jgi:hypothetical protein